MDEISLKPRIRFKGFTEAWEQRKIGDIFQFERPDNYMIEDDHYQETGIPVLTANKAFILGYRDEKGAYEKGDCIIYDDFTLDSKYVDFPFKANSSVIKILTSRDGSDLLFDYFLLSRTPILQQGHARHYISVVQPTEVRTPKNDEAGKIKDLLSSIESLITLHQRKYDKLTQIKKSLLEKMFPADGESTPKIRFKGYTEAWEQRQCSDIANRYDNFRIPVAESKRISGSTPYYGANGIQDYVSGYTHDGEFVLVAEDGANDLKNYPVQYVNGRIWVNNHAHVLQSNQNNSTMFLKYLINSADIESVLVGGGRAKLNANVLMDLDFLIPEKDEQTKISLLLDTVDRVITLHQREQKEIMEGKNDKNK